MMRPRFEPKSVELIQPGLYRLSHPAAAFSVRNLVSEELDLVPGWIFELFKFLCSKTFGKVAQVAKKFSLGKFWG